jgi:hypothetical protein
MTVALCIARKFWAPQKHAATLFTPMPEGVSKLSLISPVADATLFHGIDIEQKRAVARTRDGINHSES